MTTIGIVGAGVMGAGIAQVAAAHGCAVELVDVDEGTVRKAIDGIAKQLQRLVDRNKLTTAQRDQALGNLRVAGPASLSDCDLILEAVSEQFDVKVAVLEPIVCGAKPPTIFASNTSSLSITGIGQTLDVGRRLAGMHFFNPAPLMPLVEVIAGDESDPAVVDRIAALATSWGKTVVRAKDTPGFIVNRVARGYYLEALRMLGEGAATIGTIDHVMRELGGFRLGPFELMDLVGIDVNYSVTQSVWEQLGRPARHEPHPIQADLFARGQLGRKSKRGFYDYRHDPPKPVVVLETRPFSVPEPVENALDSFVSRAALRKGSGIENYVFARILSAVINEAAIALDDRVATREDINIAMRLGTNYPRGPLDWAEQIGRALCGRMLLALNATVPDGRFRPARSLVE
jgi:3-hydroxybutyryl-CoA dehydrogenase